MIIPLIILAVYALLITILAICAVIAASEAASDLEICRHNNRQGYTTLFETTENRVQHAYDLVDDKNNEIAKLKAVIAQQDKDLEASHQLVSLITSGGSHAKSTV